MTNDIWNDHIESDDFQRLLEQLGDVPANEAEGDDVTHEEPRDDNRKQGNGIRMEISYVGDLSQIYKAIEAAYESMQRPARRYARNFFKSIQEQAHSDTTARAVLNALNHACGLVNKGATRRDAVSIIEKWPPVFRFTHTDVWSVFGYEVSRATGYAHNNTMLLCDLLDVALETDDDI